MAQFLVLARDGVDDGAARHRAGARDAHLALAGTMDNHVYLGGPLLDQDRTSIVGSVLVVEFPGRDELDAWLRQEPFVTQGVWQNIEVTPIRFGSKYPLRIEDRSDS